MSDQTLSRRAMAAGLRWERGMVSLPDADDPYGERWICLGQHPDGPIFALLTRWEGEPLLPDGRPPLLPDRPFVARNLGGDDWLPDLDDDATLGCLEGQVRRALAPVSIAYDDSPDPGGATVWGRVGRDLCEHHAPTLAKALVAALEAHHGRL